MHNMLIPRFGSSFSISFSQFKSSPLRQSTFLFFSSFGTLSKSNPKDDNFTVSYLIHSCGLSPETAVRISKTMQLKTLDKPNAVLFFLRNYGFSEPQIAKLVKARPLVLVANAEKTLLPKLKFIHSIGVPSSQVPEVISRSPQLLLRSLKNCLIPRIEVLKSVLCSDEQVFRTLNRSALGYVCDYQIKNLVPNVSVLREFGVPQAFISNLVMWNTRTAFMDHSRFVEAVLFVKEIGVDPLKGSFVSAIHVIHNLNMDRSKWESRLKAYEKWGWSREMSLSLFRRLPPLMSFTEERIAKSMNFLVKDMGWSSEDIARFPAVLGYKLETRVIPRCTVIKVLKSKRLVKNNLGLGFFMSRNEEFFLKMFVNKFLKDVPLLLDVYRGLVDHQNVL